MKLPCIIRSLSRIEKCLWFSSVALIVISFLSVPQKDYFTLAASVIGVTSLIFLAKGYVVGQVLMVIFSLIYGLISFYFTYYGETITYVGMTMPMAILAAIEWTRNPFENTLEVKVAALTVKKIVIMTLLAITVTVLFYYILKAFNTANILFSTVSIATSFIACYLTFVRSPYYALAYAANDIVLIILWSFAAIENMSYMPMIVCFILFLVNDFYGFVSWRNMYKRQMAGI